MAEERWATVREFEHYEVSDAGHVRRATRGRKGPYAAAGRFLKLRCSGSGYLRCWLYDGKKTRPRSVHRLVAEAFIGERPPGHEVNHKDGDKWNNCATNLEYLTPKQNTAHAVATGIRKLRFGQEHHNAKLSNEQVEEIKKLAGKMKQRDIAKMFGCGQTTISSWVRGRTRKTKSVVT